MKKALALAILVSIAAWSVLAAAYIKLWHDYRTVVSCSEKDMY